MRGRAQLDEVAGVVLAGGRARRFGGRNKAFLEIGGERIVDRQLALLRQVTGSQVVIANVPEEFADLGVPVRGDVVPDAGPLGGLHAALVATRASRALVLACDLPFLNAAFLWYLVEHAPDADVVVPLTAEGVHPLCAVYATRLAPLIEARLAGSRRAVHELFEDVATLYVPPRVVAVFDPDGGLLANVNAPADYDAALARARAAASRRPPTSLEADPSRNSAND
jgi:molybdopterin-guanine dinucleotide biosynthesis protein A